MITEDNKRLLSAFLTDSIPTLFLGAGFSIGSKGTSNTMDGTKLNDYIYTNNDGYIDLGYNVNETTEYEIMSQVDHYMAVDGALLGSRLSGNGMRLLLYADRRAQDHLRQAHALYLLPLAQCLA